MTVLLWCSFPSLALSFLTRSRLRRVTCCWGWTSQRCWAVWCLWIKWRQVSGNMCNMCALHDACGCFYERQMCAWALTADNQVWCIYILPFMSRYRRGQWLSVCPTLFSPSHQVIWVAVLSGFTGPILQAAAEPVSQSGKVDTQQHSVGTQI